MTLHPCAGKRETTARRGEHVVSAPIGVVATGPLQDHTAATRPIKLLVIEDSEDDVKLAMRTLRRGGFDPTYRRVQDRDALAIALAAQPWDAVLADFSLPGFDGLEALALF